MSKKFSQFVEDNIVRQGDISVGLRDGENAQFDFPGDGIKDADGNYLIKYRAAGDTATNWVEFTNSLTGQPVIVASDGIDENVSLIVKSHADGTLVLLSPQNGDIDIALGGSGNINFVTNAGFLYVNETDPYDAVSDDVTLSADSSTTLPTQHAVKTYVDNSTPVLSQTFITNTDETGSLPNSDPLSTKATGLLASATATGALTTRILTGTTNEIDIANGDGSADPTVALSATIVTPGTLTLGGTFYVTGENIEATSGNITLITDGASAIDLDSPTVLVEQDIVHAGDPDNKITFGTDTQNYQTGGNSRLDISDTGVRLGGTDARITSISDDTTMAADSSTLGVTQHAVKTYVDTQGGSAVTLTSAGGTETLVNDGVGPALFTKGLTAGTGISLSSDGVSVTITNSDAGATVTLSNAGTTSLVNDGVGPNLFTKGLAVGAGMAAFGVSATDVTINLSVPVSIANGGTNNTAAIGASGTLVQSDGTKYTYTTATFPATATGTGTFLRADGTNWVASTATLPNTAAQGDLLYGSASNVWTSLAKNTSATRYLSNTGTSNNPAWAQIDLSNGVTGVLPIANGGTNTSAVIGASGTIAQSDGTKYTFTTATYPATSGSAGTILRSDGTNIVNSTATFANTYTASNLLYSNGSNTVTGLATANSGVLVTNSTGVPAWSSTMTNGQVIIGSTGATPTAAALTQGTGITITNGAGTITIAASGGGSLPTVTNSAALVSTSAGAAIWTSTMTNGQLVIGNTGGTPATATLTQGTGMTITNGAGTITVALSTPVSIANGGTNTTSAIGASGTLAQSDGTKYTWTTATYPSTAGTAGKIHISDGTNIVASTPTYPNSATGTGKILRADGTNWVASTATYPDTATGTGTFLRADGTNWVASTATIPGTAGTSGTLLQSNGTNWVNTTATYPGTSGTSGTILRSNGTNIVNSTSTFADTYSASTILYSNGANTVTGLATANSAVLVTNSSGVPAWSSTMTNGQLIIGNTSGTPTAAAITAGSGISVTNGAGSITLAVTGGGLPWTEETTTSRTMAVNNAYIANNAGLVTFTLPTTAAIGSVFYIQNKGAGLFKIAQNASQSIRFGGSTTTSGTGGSLTITARDDWLYVVCITADTLFVATGSGATTIV